MTRRDVNATGGMAGHNDVMLHAARAIYGRHQPTSAELKLARRMARELASWSDIRAVLGWDCTLQTTINRLRKFNIICRLSTKGTLKPHLGGPNYLPEGHGNGVDARPWRAKGPS